MKTPEVFYFGKWPGIPGHYLHAIIGERWGRLSPESVGCPWPGKELDCGLLPDYHDQPEGFGVLVHKEGWTCFSFWNRRFDGRFNSNSAFLMNAEVDFQELLASACSALPGIFEGLSGLVLRTEAGETFVCGSPFPIPAEAQGKIKPETTEQDKAAMSYNQMDEVIPESLPKETMPEAFPRILGHQNPSGKGRFRLVQTQTDVIIIERLHEDAMRCSAWVQADMIVRGKSTLLDWLFDLAVKGALNK